MPELPEVETIVRGLQQKIIGQKIEKIRINLPKIIRGDKNEFISLIQGASFQRIQRRGKLLIFTLSNDLSMIVHLKLTGQLIYMLSDQPVAKHTHLIFDLTEGAQLRYIDLRQFGYFLLTETSQLDQLENLKELGSDPLTISLKDFKTLFKKKKGRIKILLLNQKFLAGIGNIYSDEILFKTKIHPFQEVNALSDFQIENLYQAMIEVLNLAIKHKGYSVSDYVDSSGESGSFQEFHQVYQREKDVCFRCGHKINRLKIGSRSTYFCPICQPDF